VSRVTHSEIAAADESERKAKRQGRRELLRARHEHDEAAVNAKIGELKAELHRGESPTATADEAVTADQ
jgi:hypothetical protein